MAQLCSLCSKAARQDADVPCHGYKGQAAPALPPRAGVGVTLRTHACHHMPWHAEHPDGAPEADEGVEMA